MKLNELNPKDRIPDNYRNQVISKLEELNTRIDNIKRSSDITDNRRSVYCYEVNWLKGNYTFTDVNVGGLCNDLIRIHDLIKKIELWENFKDGEHKKNYLEYFFIENND
jgi:hypothetical protein